MALLSEHSLLRNSRSRDRSNGSNEAGGILFAACAVAVPLLEELPGSD
jgi:hypothetical protein